MKIFYPQKHKTQSQGMALVVVLSLLALLTVLVVGFLSRSGIERASASAYFDGNQNSILADEAVGVVQTQIDAASTQKKAGAAVPWASQPGMVRTFQQDGKLELAYKLYSDDAMVSDEVNLATATDALTNWKNKPAYFTDLNEPVIANGKKSYPILDANAIDTVEGFTATSTNNITSTDQPVPMPVKWLYVLQDGQMVAPTGSDATKATVAGASQANPIVGRIAFWTDDETAKLNINTAAHGYFWDIPRASTEGERDRMARFQPALREFQRYPGHPATTSLWPVFGSKFGNEDAFADWVYDLAPRIVQGGSEGGTRIASDAITLDKDRLYSSVDELLFSAHHGERAAEANLTSEDIERSKFFLTARSNAPEINLFNLPRMAIWPINAGITTTTSDARKPSTLDELIAFCATINQVPYYFQRNYPDSPTLDMTSGSFGSQNTALYNYINALLGKPFPGFGSGKFTDSGKYGTDVPQITTEIFDYIRSSNLYSTALGADNYTGAVDAKSEIGSRVGQVAPLHIGNTKGIGRLPVLSKAIFQLYVSGIKTSDGKGGSLEFSDSLIPPVQTPVMQDIAGTNAYKMLKAVLKVQDTDTEDTKDFELITRGIVYFDFFDPMYGYTYPRYNFDVDVDFSGDWTVNGKALDFPPNATLEIHRDQTSLYNSKNNNLAAVWYGRFLGGHLGALYGLQNYTYMRGNMPNPVGALGSKFYPLVSVPVEIHQTLTLNKESGDTPEYFVLPDANTIADTVSFSGGTIAAQVKIDANIIQKYTFKFPSFTKKAPVYMDSSLETPAIDTLEQFSVNVDFRNRLDFYPTRNIVYYYPNINKDVDKNVPDNRLIQENDVAVALEPKGGDKRLLATRFEITEDNFEPHEFYADPTRRIAAEVRVEYFGADRAFSATRTGIQPGRIVPLTYGNNGSPDIPSLYHAGLQESGLLSFPPDFDNGTFHRPDDSYANRADEGSNLDQTEKTGSNRLKRNFAWYMDGPDARNESDKGIDYAGSGFLNNETFFSPNKQMPSAGMFGSLPTGAMRDKVWQTLLFRPDPGNHPGAKVLPDHLLLDLFWMPVVEPYAISERFSTNGKVNLNYQIMPFGGYLERSTGLYGVMHSLETVAINNNYSGGPKDGNNANSYKAVSDAIDPQFGTFNIRKKINIPETLKSFEKKFGDNDLYISESQICEIPLIPEGASWSSNFEAMFWKDYRLTGDNSREMPYTQLLPRLTTKSNTYTVHYRVQTLKKLPTTDPGVWDESKDRVAAELRGSRMIERYIDPNNTSIPNYSIESDPTTPNGSGTLEQFYRWRVLSNREFTP